MERYIKDMEDLAETIRRGDAERLWKYSVELKRRVTVISIRLRIRVPQNRGPRKRCPICLDFLAYALLKDYFRGNELL